MLESNKMSPGDRVYSPQLKIYGTVLGVDKKRDIVDVRADNPIHNAIGYTWKTCWWQLTSEKGK